MCLALLNCARNGHDEKIYLHCSIKTQSNREKEQEDEEEEGVEEEDSYVFTE